MYSIFDHERDACTSLVGPHLDGSETRPQNGLLLCCGPSESRLEDRVIPSKHRRHGCPTDIHRPYCARNRLIALMRKSMGDYMLDRLTDPSVMAAWDGASQGFPRSALAPDLAEAGYR